MSGFKELRDVSNRFEHELQQASKELFTAKFRPSFADDIDKKLKDLALVSSKQKLLDAKPLSLTPQVFERVNESTLAEYGDTAVWKVLEKVTAKSLTQSHAVTALMNTPDSSLDPEMVERKKLVEILTPLQTTMDLDLPNQSILDTLNQFRQVECDLRHLNSLSIEAESQADGTREELDQLLVELRDCKDQRKGEDENRGPMYDKLSILVDKLELMRWLIGRLVCAPSSQTPYDWLADPHRQLEALPLTRQHYTVEGFITD